MLQEIPPPYEQVESALDHTGREMPGDFQDWIDATLAHLSPGAKVLGIGSREGLSYIESFGFKVERAIDPYTPYDLIVADKAFLYFTPEELETVLK